jgi:hypothetical protein
MRKTTGLGPSNDEIPEDEMLLAKMVQNVLGRGMVKIHGPTYKTEGRRKVAACALGAVDVDRRTRGMGDYPWFADLARGFENWSDLGSMEDGRCGYDAGMAYDDAIDQEHPDSLRELGHRV